MSFRLSILATLALVAASMVGGTAVVRAASAPPNRVLIVLFDQMIPQYADQFDMPNFRG